MVENAEKMDALFVNLILLFKNAALQQMGKIMNPITGKIDKSMEQARFSIDMIEMLKEKTRSNLSDELGRLLDTTLLELRMNYVEEVEAEARGAAKGEGEKKESPEAGKPEIGEEEEVKPEAEEKATERAAEKKPPGKGRTKGRKRGKRA